MSSAWRVARPSLLVRHAPGSSTKVAGFDLNDTLVSTRSGRPGYMTTVDDWQLYNGQVAPKLQELHKQGYRLVIFTNQGGIKSAVQGKRAQTFQKYVDALLEELQLPILVLAATQTDSFRKPALGMWNFLENEGNSGVVVDRTQSFYVGDAAGREGDHSADDLNFAKACGVRFEHTDHFFASSGHWKNEDVFKDAISRQPGRSLGESVECGVEAIRSAPLVLVLVGPPGSGKSTFAQVLGPPVLKSEKRLSKTATNEEIVGDRTHPSKWRRVCQDILGNRDACMRAAKACLKLGICVVVDRTNYDAEQRSLWLRLAKECNVQCHCLVFNVELQECCRRVEQRTGHEGNLQGKAARAVIMRLSSQMQPVTTGEGFLTCPCYHHIQWH